MAEEIHWLRTVSSSKNDLPSRFGGMYVRFAGSGSNAAVLTKEPPKFLRSHIHEGQHLFTSWKHPGKQWALRLIAKEENERLANDPSKTNRPFWSPVEIGEGEAAGDSGFKFLGDPPTLSNAHVKGWMVCEWAIGHPQLFYLTDAYDESKGLPDFCERVQLVQEQVREQVRDDRIA